MAHTQPGFRPRHVSEAALYYLLQEEVYKAGNSFVRDESSSEAVPGVHQAIASGEKCPNCMDTMSVSKPKHGKITGIRILAPASCPCIILRNFYQHWNNPKKVGKAYKTVSIGRLFHFAANFQRFENTGKLEELVETVKQYPTNSYLLSGPHGLGKTTLIIALYHRALAVWAHRVFALGNPTEAVFIVNATTLSAEFRVWEMKDDGRDKESGEPTPLPTVTAN